MNYINITLCTTICVLLIYIVYLRKQNKVLRNIEEKRDEYIEQLELFGNNMNYYVFQLFYKIQIILDMFCTNDTYLSAVGSIRCDMCDIRSTYDNKGKRLVESTTQTEIAYELVNRTINKISEEKEKENE